MKNIKIKITEDIINSIRNNFTENQLKTIENAITIILYDYKIEEEKHELEIYDNDDRFLCEQYYGSLKVEGKSQGTIERYFLQIKLMLSYIQKPIRDITTEDLRYYYAKYQTERKVSNTTLDGMRKCISAFFSWLEASDYIAKSPARRIKQIKNDTVQERELTAGEVENAMLHCESVRDKAILQFMYDTAARVSEITKVTLNDIDFDERTVLLHGKGGKDRISLFTDKSSLYLKKYLSERNYRGNELFCTKKAPYTKVSKSSLELMVKKIGQLANIDHLHPHRFRVTRITNLINRGMPLQDVQELAGHSNINTTRGYYRNNIENIKYSYRRAI